MGKIWPDGKRSRDAEGVVPPATRHGKSDRPAGLRVFDGMGRIALRLHAKDAKIGVGRVIAVEGPLRTIIERRMKARQFGCDLIFHRNGEMIGTFYKRWRQACLAAGVASKIPYDLRRTAVRNMIRARRAGASGDAHQRAQDQGGVRPLQHRLGERPAGGRHQDEHLRAESGPKPESRFCRSYKPAADFEEGEATNPKKTRRVLGESALLGGNLAAEFVGLISTISAVIIALQTMWACSSEG